MMTPRRRNRLTLLALGAAFVAGAAALGLSAMQDSIMYFRTPTDIAAGDHPDRAFRLGGMVLEGSVRFEGVTAIFDVTDTVEATTVAYSGALPDLFREGQGVVVQGRMGPNGIFQAAQVLAKHDENYMPPEAAEALRRAGATLDDADAAPGSR